MNANLANNVLHRAKPEILRVVEMLITKMNAEVVDLLVEVCSIDCLLKLQASRANCRYFLGNGYYFALRRSGPFKSSRFIRSISCHMCFQSSQPLSDHSQDRSWCQKWKYSFVRIAIVEESVPGRYVFGVKVQCFRAASDGFVFTR